LSNSGSKNGNGNNKVHPLAKRLSNSFNAGASKEANGNEESKISQSNQFTFSQAKAKLSGLIRAKANRKETAFRPRKDTLYDDPEMVGNRGRDIIFKLPKRLNRFSGLS
jgi:hypothetical protein